MPQALLLLGCLQLVALCSCKGQRGADKVVSLDSPCVLAANPSQYSNQRIKVTADIASTIEGMSIWSDGCNYPGITLYFSDVLTRKEEFRQTVLNHRMGETLAKATLIGRFRYRRFTSVRALIFGQKTFEAEQVINPEFRSTIEGPRTPGAATTVLHEAGHADPPKQQ